MVNSFHESSWRSSGEMTHEGRLGVIDIGSNSVRLVVYDAIKRTPLPLFNEKIFCGLGKGLAITGKLNPEGVKLAEGCIKRFLALVHIMDVVELQIIATAAVRDASDGAEFVENLERKFRINITVISGKKEAQLAASGIFSSIYKPEGLAGDLGGGSIELISLQQGGLANQTTIPIGPLRIIDNSKGDKTKMAKIINDALDNEKWLPQTKYQHFFAIGGSFRAIARIQMAREKYPLEIVHHYSIKNAPMRKLLKEIINSTPQQLEKMPGVPSKRVESLIPAALVLERILDIINPEDVIFSSYGIREGYLFEKLSPYLRNEDPLIASCTDLANQNGRVPGYARELFNWMTPIFEKESEIQKRLRFAACILSEVAWRIHPEYSAGWAFSRIIQSNLIGLSHSERVTLALVLFHRHQYKLKNISPIMGLLGDNEKNWARLIGTLSNLAFLLSGAMSGNLENVPISASKNKLSIDFIGEAKDLRSDAIDKKIENAGDSFKQYMKHAK
ncbi:MAG: Ppx/GppA family phosphatase [Pseudomonadota bacterium]